MRRIVHSNQRRDAAEVKINLNSERRVHYVLSTHWDREWFLTQQDYRYRLVQLLDRVIDGLVSGELRGPFQTDGQSIPLEDYLEIRTERRELVEQMVQDGRLVVGPWYVLPDEFLVSGESLVRNLKLGRQWVRDLGGQPSEAGFVCDLFGHNSQMPQIFAGFNIRGGFIWRGNNQAAERHLRWRGADGTELACYRFGRIGYCEYAAYVRFGREPEHVFDAAETETALAAFLDREAAATKLAPILLFDGCDHQEWDRQTYAVLAPRIGAPDGRYDIQHTSLDGYLADMLAEAGQIGPQVSGELREPGTLPAAQDEQWVIPGVLSSRVWIKQANAECQALLCQWAEPMAALAQAALGKSPAPGFLHTAWKWLLQNHPHDSIGGCSIDAVHDDMRYRFEQSRRIADRLTLEATRDLAANVAGEVGQDELRVVVFNPLPRPVRQMTEITLQIPTTWPGFNEFFGFEPKPGFRLYAPDGQEVPYQRLGQAMAQNGARLFDHRFPQSTVTHHVRVCLGLEIPALGYTTFVARPDPQGLPTRHPNHPGLATSERSMANEFLEVAIEANGTLTLTDKRTGQSFTRLLTFEDAADIGDGWYHGQAVNDQVFASSASPAAVALVHDGPLLTTFRIRTRLTVPARFDFKTMRRSDELVELALDTLVSLRAGADYLECEVRVDNTVRDHRLRCLFPTNVPAETYLADSPFDVVERPIALNPGGHVYRELELETRPQQTWTAVAGPGRGLAVISTGLMESAVRDQAERPIALTLYRSTGRTVFSNGEPGGQLLGPLSFQFWLAPLAGQPDRAALCGLGQFLAGGLRDVQLTRLDATQRPRTADLPPRTGYLEVRGPVVLTSARFADDGAVGAGLEVRLFNPNSEPAAASVELDEGMLKSWRPAAAQRVDFEGNAAGPAEPLRRLGVDLELGPKQIVTLRFIGAA
jgi:alpha-mannosidase/mannosylglycerate hydrolase